jgi:ketosteroid isomerase-like protein
MKYTLLASAAALTVLASGAAAMADDRGDILALEQQRVAALNALDHAALAALMSDDFLQVHTTGLVTDKVQTVAGAKAHPRALVRGPLTVRVWGDTAVITGEQNSGELKPGEAPFHAMAMEVAHRTGGQWRLVSVAVTPIKTP